MTKKELMTGYCNDCEKRGKCKILCEKVEWFGNLDWIEWEDRVILSPESVGDDQEKIDWTDYRGPIELGLAEFDIIEQSGLSKRQRECVWFFYFKRHTVYEIAGMLNISVGSVKKHLSRSREKIKKKLQYSYNVAT